VPERQRRLLVADEDPLLRRFLETALRRDGHQVDSCATGSEAIERSALNVYDVLILSMDLPSPGGLDLAESLRTARNHTPIVLVANLLYRLPSPQLDRVFLLIKPFSLEELKSILRTALESAGSA
jgi:two-component system, OmpR family, response regulator MprA